jgi:hypothetical protein
LPQIAAFSHASAKFEATFIYLLAGSSAGLDGAGDFIVVRELRMVEELFTQLHFREDRGRQWA